MKSILYFKNCNSDAIAVTEVSQLNENNKTLKDSYGNIYENVIREENHNANQLLKGNLAFFIEDYGENFDPNMRGSFNLNIPGSFVPDPLPIDKQAIIPNPNPDDFHHDTTGTFIAGPVIPEPKLPNDNVQLSDSVTPNRYGYIPNEIKVGVQNIVPVRHPRGWNLTKAYRDSLNKNN